MNDFLIRAAERTGFTRDYYFEKKLPENPSQITVTPFFGDIKSEFILSTILHKRIKEENLSDRYWIICTHPGRAALYPFADEVWGIKGPEVAKVIANDALGFNPNNNRILHIIQTLNRFFGNMYETEELLSYYDCGLTKKFFDTMGKVMVQLPSVGSAKVEFSRTLSENSRSKVFISPVKRFSVLNQFGVETLEDISDKFWMDLGESLLTEGVTTVWQFGPSYYDLSHHFVSRSLYCTDLTVHGILASMRATGCVLGVFSDNCLMSVIARTPFIWFDDRRRYNHLKLYELEDLIFPGLQRSIGFSFPGLATSSNYSELIKSIVNRVVEFLPTIDKDRLPSTGSQQYDANYANVRKKKAKKFGTRFFKVTKID